MRRVEIKTGVYGRRDEKGRVQPVVRGEQVELSDGEAVRLVLLGVAAYTDGPAAAPAASTDNEETAGASWKNTPGSAAPAEDAAGGGETAPADAEAARLERMQKADLEAMATDMGLDISGAKTKHELAVLIAAAGEEDGGEPPELSAGDIVQ